MVIEPAAIDGAGDGIAGVRIRGGRECGERERARVCAEDERERFERDLERERVLPRPIRFRRRTLDFCVRGRCLGEPCFH